MWKPNLTLAMKAARLAFEVEYKDWTIEDWKKLIQTDKTSVVLEQRKGSHRIWGTPLEGEKPVTSTIRERYHNATEFMFWASFSWDQKRPCHCWEKETAAEKKEAATKIAAINTAIEPKAQAEWELSIAANRLRLDNNVPGQKP